MTARASGSTASASARFTCLRQVVAAFRQRHPDWDCVVSTTTDTGFDEARKHFADLPVIFWPLDFTWAVRRALRRVRPRLVVLAESEVWPNFLSQAKKHGVRVAIINGRMSPRSFRRYRKLPWLARRLFGRLDLCVAQTEEYAECFRRLGVPAGAVKVTGSVKFDGVATDRDNPRTQELRRLLARRSRTTWSGSPAAPRPPRSRSSSTFTARARSGIRTLRLFVVPRQKDRFDEVATLLKRGGLPFLRRSELHEPVTRRDAIILMDTHGRVGRVLGPGGRGVRGGQPGRQARRAEHDRAGGLRRGGGVRPARVEFPRHRRPVGGSGRGETGGRRRRAGGDGVPVVGGTAGARGWAEPRNGLWPASRGRPNGPSRCSGNCWRSNRRGVMWPESRFSLRSPPRRARMWASREGGRP